MNSADSFDPYAPVSMGTTILGCKYNGGVILAMDSKTSAGNFISDRSAIKGNQISPSVLNYGPIYVLRCGDAAASQVVTRYVYNYLTYHAMELGQDGRIDLKTVATIYKNICYGNKDNLSCAFILSNGKELIEIDSSGALIHSDLIASHGSGSVFCRGFLTFHARPNMSREQTIELMTRAVALAVDVDCSSGGNINLYDLSVDGKVEKVLIDHNSIDQICKGLAAVKI